jgi:hypothetical protein
MGQEEIHHCRRRERFTCHRHTHAVAWFDCVSQPMMPRLELNAAKGAIPCISIAHWELCELGHVAHESSELYLHNEIAQTRVRRSSLSAGQASFDGMDDGESLSIHLYVHLVTHAQR